MSLAGLRICTKAPELAWVFLLLGSIALPVQAQDTSGAGSGSGGAESWFSAEVYGRAPYPLNSRGLRLGHDLAEGREVELTYVVAQQKVLLSDFHVSEYELRMNTLIGSVAYWGLGVGVRDVALTYDVFVAEEGVAQHIEEKAQGFTAHGHFGFKLPLASWLSVGTDLYGLSMPLFWTKHSGKYPDGAEDFEENPRDFPYVNSGFGLCFQMVRTYLRFRF